MSTSKGLLEKCAWLWLLLAGCDAAPVPSPAAGPPPSVVPAASSRAPTASTESAPALKAPIARPPDPELLARLGQSAFVGAQVVSPRSLSLRVTLAGEGPDAVFKPVRRDNGTCRNEVAVFRLAASLDLAGVPPAVMREVPLALLERLVAPRSPELAARLAGELAVDGRGRVAGALITWLPGLEATPLARDATGALWGAWLRADAPHPPDPELAAHLAAALAFDWIVGNWDRFSGGNLFLLPGGRQLALIDNNGALGTILPERAAKLDAILAPAERFPRGFIQRLRAWRAVDIDGALAAATMPDGRPLVGPATRTRLLERRDRFLERLAGLVARFGEAAVLPWP